jgi:hypothetical protein
MSTKGFMYSVTVVLGVIVSLTETHAFPIQGGTFFHGGEKFLTNVNDYDYPNYYRYRPDYRYGRLEDTPLALLTIPGTVLGAAFGAIASGLGGDPYANPNFADPFYAPYDDGRSFSDDYRYRDRFEGSYAYRGEYWPRYSREYGYRDRAGYYDGAYGRESRFDDRDRYSPWGYAETSYSYQPSYGAYASYGDPYYGGWSYRDYGGSYRSGGEAACAREFRSFDPGTGTYVNRYGERVFCPYIRP